MRRNRKGYTLAELLIVVAIIAVLVGISVPIYTGLTAKTKKTTCEANRRSLLAALRTAQMTDGTLSNENLLAQAAASCGASVDNGHVSGICPDGGTVTVTFYEGGIVKISCSEHGGSSDSFVTDLVGTVIKNLTTLTRAIDANGGTQTLAEYLADGTKKIDSQAGDQNYAGGYLTTTWTKTIKDQLTKDGSPIADQGWALTYDKNNKQYIMIVTTGGTSSLTSASSSKAISVIKYTVSQDNDIVLRETGTAKVDTSKTYKTIVMGSFTASE